VTCRSTATLRSPRDRHAVRVWVWVLTSADDYYISAETVSLRPSQIEPRCFAHAVALGVSTTFATALDARRADTPDWITADDTTAVTWTSVDDLALTSRYGWAYTGMSPLGGTGG